MDFGDLNNNYASLRIALEASAEKYKFVDVLRVQHTTLQDLLTTTIKLETDHISKQKSGIDVRRRLSSLISFVERYASALDCLVQTGSGFALNPAALAWGLMKILLELASSATKYFSSLLKLLERLGSTVSLYGEYLEMFRYHRFQVALGDVYLDIICILGKARKMLQRNRYLMLVRCFKSDFDADFGDDIEAVNRHLSRLKSETTLAQRLTIHDFMRDMRATVAQNSLQCNIHGVADIQHWLRPFDCESRLVNIQSLRHPQTGFWVLEHNTYLAWKHGKGSQVLWISGPPGIGKTVLSSVIIEDMRNSAQSLRIITVYFHCSTSQDSTRSEACVYASIISQITAELQMREDPSDIPSAVKEAFERSLKFGRLQMSSADNPVQILLKLTRLNHPINVIIDGLDELDNSKVLMDSLLRVAREACSFRMVLLSREIPLIKANLGPQHHINITPADVYHDIELFVKEASSKLPAEAIQKDMYLTDKICQRADGMFLWASLAIEELSKATSLREVQGILSHCPLGLQGMYGHFLFKIETETLSRKTLARNIISWVCCATRQLTVAELKVAVCADDWTSKCSPFQSVLTDICAPFIGLTTNGKYIQPVHHSVREYLLKQDGNDGNEHHNRQLLISQSAAHTDLAMCCIRYLSMYHLQDTGLKNETFLQYAMVFWCYHAVRGRATVALRTEVLQLLSTSSIRQRWLFWMLFNNDTPFPIHKVLRSQEELQRWLLHVSDGEAQMAQKPILTDWSMDILDLIMLTSHIGCDKTKGPGEISISYFEKMMVVRDLARRLKQSGKLVEAREKIESLVEGDNSKDTFNLCLLNTLGILYDQEGKQGPALQMHGRVVSYQESKSQSHGDETLWSINEMGRTYRHLGQLDKSEEMHRTALAALNLRRPEGHPELTWTTNTLANTLRKQERFHEALFLHQAAYDSRSRDLGTEHTHTLWSCGDVAKCHLALGSFEDALEWYDKAYQGRLTTLGPEHPDTLWSMNDLGVALNTIGRIDEALRLQLSALQMQERVLGPEHKHTIWTKEKVNELSEFGSSSIT
ncbi:hypothetical protein F5Y08DRAFT_300756 [Xylaria arbuscula]|nr:hypothetical protein F5Y08DRAFT_300756 [Xylaria arbuscula]